MSAIKFLGEIKNPLPQEIGGKGYSLEKLFEKKFNVPNGFVVSSDVFFRFLEANNIKEKVDNLVLGLDEFNYSEKAELIRDLINKQNKYDKNFVIELKNSLEKLGSRRVSVRSSAVGEDSLKASFAGLYNTFLNVENNLAEVIKRIKNCWVSLFNDRAAIYKLKKNLPLLDGMAVVVQEMIPAEIAGTVFTLDPDNQKEVIIIEAIRGIGEKVVSGKITPERYILKKSNLEIISKKRGFLLHKKDKASSFCLNNNQVKKIAEESLKIEKLFGYPQDIEWAICKKNLFFLQSRPITTLSQNSSLSEKEGVDWIKLMVRPAFTPLWIDHHIQAYQSIVPKIFGCGLANNLWILEDKKVSFYASKNESENLGRAIMHKIKNDRGFLENHLRDCFSFSENLVKTAKEISAKNLAKISDADLWNCFKVFTDAYGKFIIALVSPVYADKFLEKELKENLRAALKKIKKEELFDRYFKSINIFEQIPESVQEEIELLEIACKVMEFNGRINSEVASLIKRHTKKYSWISVYSYYSNPADEEFFLGRIKHIKNPKNKLKEIKEDFDRRKKLFSEIIDELRNEKELLGLINIARKYIYLRTYRTDMLKKAFFYIGFLMQEISNRTGLSRKDISYLLMEELKGLLIDKKSIDKEELEKRMSSFVIIKKQGKQPRLICGKERVIEVLSTELKDYNKATASVKGAGVFPGIAVGKAKLVFSLEEASKVEEGDILVTSMTNPSMNIAIVKAGALVTDEGGLTCHAAITSREMKIPCVVGTKIATKVFKDGDLIRVDSKKGIAEKLS